jgi:hypothetical protein
MTAPTGRGRGRPPGAKNKRTVERQQQLAEAAEQIAEAIPGAFEGDAHTFLMAVYKDTSKEMALRLDAAKAAIRYEKPALAAVDAKMQGDFGVTFQIVTGVPRAEAD